MEGTENAVVAQYMTSGGLHEKLQAPIKHQVSPKEPNVRRFSEGLKFHWSLGIEFGASLNPLESFETAHSAFARESRHSKCWLNQHTICAGLRKE
jgi:hypothetical protein